MKGASVSRCSRTRAGAEVESEEQEGQGQIGTALFWGWKAETDHTEGTELSATPVKDGDQQIYDE